MYELERKLIAAAKDGNYTAVAGLLNAKGINIDFQDPENGYVSAIFVAAHSKHLKIVELLCLRGADLTLETSEKLTPLFTAVTKGSLQIVKLLITHDNSVINQPGADGYTALHTAIDRSYNSIVTTLLNAGANVNRATEQTCITPLHLAIKKNNIPAFNLLLAHPEIQVNLSTDNDETALFMAVKAQNVYCVTQLLAHPKIDCNLGLRISNTYTFTPFHIAAYTSNTDIMKLLLRHEKIDVNQKTILGNTALHLAISKKNTSLANLLIGMPNIELYSANKCKPTFNVTANTPFGLVITNDLVEIFDAIITHPQHAQQIANYAAQGFVSPLLIAAACAPKNQEYFIYRLLQLGLDPNCVDENGETPLMFCVKTNAEATIQHLLEHRANPNIVSNCGESPLFLAAIYGFEQIASYLLTKDADVNFQRTLDLNTPLHMAVIRGHLNMVELLLLHSADHTKINCFNQSPIMLAQALQNRSTILARLYQEPRQSLKEYLRAFTAKTKLNATICKELNLTPPKMWLCPISRKIVNIPVRLDGILYDYSALLGLTIFPDGARKIPHGQKPGFHPDDRFFMSDVQPARDVQQDVAEFIATTDLTKLSAPKFCCAMDEPVVKFLADSEIDELSIFLEHFGVTENTNDSLLMKAYHALTNNDMQQLRSCIQAGVNKTRAVCPTGNSLLAQAALNTHNNTTLMLTLLYQDSRSSLYTFINELNGKKSNVAWYEELHLKPPEEWCCPISRWIPNIPVRIAGILFDYTELMKRFNTLGTQIHPITREHIFKADVQPAWDIQVQISATITAAINQNSVKENVKRQQLSI